MDKNNAPPGPKVSQMANIFQRKASDDDKDSKENPANGVMRTESHAARFNNARALFEKLGEGRINRPTTFSIKHSTSKDDNLKDPSPDRQRSPSPKKKYVGISNGVGKNDLGMIQNVSRKSEKPEKPEKPERKFNSKELIEKQKNWTSHFSKSRSPPSVGINRFDIIRTVPGTGVINNTDINKVQDSPPSVKESGRRASSIESPPSPSIRQSQLPPEIKPRTTSRSNSLTSPTKSLPSIPPTKPSPEHLRSQRQPDGKSDEVHEKPARKKSLDFSNEQLTHSNHSSLPPEVPNSRRYSSDKESSSLTSPAHVVSSAASSSGPSSPVHTEDEKQENESNEKTDIAAATAAVADDANSEGEFDDLLMKFIATNKTLDEKITQLMHSMKPFQIIQRVINRLHSESERDEMILA
jgi:neurabin